MVPKSKREKVRTLEYEIRNRASERVTLLYRSIIAFIAIIGYIAF